VSTHFTVYCEQCEAYGPNLVRAAGRGAFLSGLWPRFHPGLAADDPQTSDFRGQWTEFLIEHEYHPLKLVHE
jgi:hypothetical protein